jgi:hypothetical protein
MSRPSDSHDQPPTCTTADKSNSRDRIDIDYPSRYEARTDNNIHFYWHVSSIIGGPDEVGSCRNHHVYQLTNPCLQDRLIISTAIPEITE